LETMKGRKDITLRAFNRQLLLVAGYSDEEIGRLGPLNELQLERMEELLRKKIDEYAMRGVMCPNCGQLLNKEALHRQ